MVVVLLVVLASLLSSLFYYVAAFRVGLSPYRWALAGLILGPLLLPLFSIRQQLAMRQAQGFGNAYLWA